MKLSKREKDILKAIDIIEKEFGVERKFYSNADWAINPELAGVEITLNLLFNRLGTEKKEDE